MNIRITRELLDDWNMRIAGGSAEFQKAFDRAKELL